MNEIMKPENLELVDTIILNGIVGMCTTYDENYETIGIKSVCEIPTFQGKIIKTESDGFPLTKKMEDKLGWGKYCASVRMVTGSTPIDPTKVEETIIECFEGDAKGEYYHRYSDYTGYLWTEENFIVGGHDIPNILRSHMDEYIHMEIELYKQKTKLIKNI